jgi:hypothetical protein
MVSEQRARKIINSLRKAWGSGTTQDLVHEAFGRVLDKYSLIMYLLTPVRLKEDLYSDPCHFILEILQNADDNVYKPLVKPTLNLKLSRERLIIECNEKGFTEDDVKSLCNVVSSTKTSSGTKTGEKGLGTSD